MTLKQSILLTLLTVLAFLFILDYWSVKQTVLSQGRQIEDLRTAQRPLMIVENPQFFDIVASPEEILIIEQPK